MSKVGARVYLALSYSLFVLIILSGASTYWVYRQESLAEESLLIQLKERARLIATTWDVQGFDTPVEGFPTVLTATNQNLQVVFFSTQFQIRNLSDIAVSAEEKSIIQGLGGKALQGETVVWEDETVTPDQEVLYAAAPVYNNQGVVVGAVCLLLPLFDFHKSVDQLRSDLLMLSAILGLLALGLGVILAHPFVTPLLRAQRLARRVAQGDYSQRLPITGVAEMAKLTADLNQMTDDLANESKLRKLVLANVTHELARPLGGLRLAVDSLQKGAMDNETTAKALLVDMRETLRGMATMLEDLALAAKPGNTKLQLHPVSINLDVFLRKLVQRYKIRAHRRDIVLNLKTAPQKIILQADKNRLSQIVGNLISNALKFTPTGGHVLVQSEEQMNDIKISFEDTGSGISDADMEKIFEPFFQGGNVGKIRQGMGLGLTIVRQLVDAHGGKLEITNLPTGGLRVDVILPKIAKPSKGLKGERRYDNHK